MRPEPSVFTNGAMSETQASFQTSTPRSPIEILRRKSAVVALIYGISLAGGFWLLDPLRQPYNTLWYRVFLVSLVMVYLLWQFYQGLADNHREDETTLLSTLGLGNCLTLLRGIAIGFLAGFLFSLRPMGNLFAWLPATLYTTVIVLDYFDGYAARVTNHVTKLGGALDGIFDVSGFLIAVGLVIWYGQLSIMFLLAGLAHYLFSFGLWWRRIHNRPVYDLPPSKRRRLLAGFEMSVISLLLWPLNIPITVTNLVGLIFILPVLIGFWRDWLVVSGRINIESQHYKQIRANLSSLFDHWLPPLLRCIVVIVSLVYLLPFTLNINVSQLSANSSLSSIMALGVGFTTVMILLGTLTRVASLGLLIPTFMLILSVDLTFSSGLLLVSLSLLTLLGGGKWSMWQADDVWVYTKAGA